jgi:hypothetical protein
MSMYRRLKTAEEDELKEYGLMVLRIRLGSGLFYRCFGAPGLNAWRAFPDDERTTCRK